MKSILITLFRVFILNVIIFALLFFICITTCFLLGWADSGDHSTATWLLYGGFVLFHLIINLLFINPIKKSQLYTFISTALIIILNGIVVYIYR